MADERCVVCDLSANSKLIRRGDRLLEIEPTVICDDTQQLYWSE
jgi:hypothetical protein